MRVNTNTIIVGAGAVVAAVSFWFLYKKLTSKKKGSSNILTSFHPDFHECCLLVGRCIGKLSVEEQLYFYGLFFCTGFVYFVGLFKQITQGDCTIPQPSKLDVVELKKYEAWRSLIGMPQDEAMDAYFSAAMNIPDEITAPHKEWAEKEMLRQRLGDDESELDLDNLSDDEGPSGNDGMGAGPSKMSDPYDPFGNQAQEVTNMTDGVDKLCRLLSAQRIKEATALLQAQPALAVQFDENHSTPLHWAADCGSVEMIEALLAAGADLDAEDGDGETALSTAVLSEQAAVVKILLEKGARTDRPEGDDSAADRGRTASDKEIRAMFGF